ncbi:AT-hook motif nuclear-localized protein 28-like isoform X2 [Lathyrus oleraceus]|uniref:AT-hook motif nuclear-localized protein 28-like isoform X2 n=1 Tax=Pisum sativum TaxID=3888 RepID=UPI0021CFC289|nr:AT-hook motif nuclear-localized protein 28-like isoform X2 [Pisum sativum]
MARKELASSSFPSNFNPPSSNNDSSENNHSMFPTHPDNPFSKRGGNNKFMVSIPPTITNNNDTLVMPQPSSAAPSSHRYMDLPQDPSEDVTKSSSRKRTGRPLGSKNRPKAHIIVEEDTQTLTELVGLEIPIGEDIAENIIKYAQQRQVNITVSRGFVLISNVVLLYPISRVPLLSIEGPIHMTTLFGTYINPNCQCTPTQFVTHLPCSSFTVYFSSPNEYAFGGVVGGKITAASVIFINVTLTRKIVIHEVVSTNINV